MSRYEKINPKTKTAWLTALRSGKYQQGRNMLRSGDDRFCCLGVLCETKNLKATMQDGFSYYDYDFNGERESSYFPDSFLAEINLSDEAQSHLMNMNDGDRYDFNKIADWIEENL